MLRVCSSVLVAVAIGCGGSSKGGGASAPRGASTDPEPAVGEPVVDPNRGPLGGVSCDEPAERKSAGTRERHLTSKPGVVGGWRKLYGNLQATQLARPGSVGAGAVVVCFEWLKSSTGATTFTALQAPTDMTIEDVWRPNPRSQWWTRMFEFARFHE